MQAKISQEGEVIVVHLTGRVDVETAVPFREACLNHLIGKKVVFDFTHLSFVGSSGILPFLETMQEFASQNRQGFKFSGVGSEFKKVFSATSLSVVEIYDGHRVAALSFANPPRVVARPVAGLASEAGTAGGASLVGQAAPQVSLREETQAPSQAGAQVSPLGLRIPPCDDESSVDFDEVDEI